MDLDLHFQPCVSADAEAIVTWISGDHWPFHGAPRPRPELVREWVSKGRLWGEDVQSFWIVVDGERAGLLSLRELSDPTPVFDLRLGTRWRGRGIGRLAVGWLTDHVFRTTDKRRIEAYTRRDNIAMRKVLRACGWVKEAHHRESWPAEDGAMYDAVGYAALKRDWAEGSVTPVAWNDEP